MLSGFARGEERPGNARGARLALGLGPGGGLGLSGVELSRLLLPETPTNTERGSTPIGSGFALPLGINVPDWRSSCWLGGNVCVWDESGGGGGVREPRKRARSAASSTHIVHHRALPRLRKLARARPVLPQAPAVPKANAQHHSGAQKKEAHAEAHRVDPRRRCTAADRAVLIQRRRGRRGC